MIQGQIWVCITGCLRLVFAIFSSSKKEGEAMKWVFAAILSLVLLAGCTTRGSYRHAPCLKAFHPTFSGDAVLIRLTTIGGCGRNQTCIASQLVRRALL